MLIRFEVGNFLSFKDIVSFSMIATSIKEHDENVFHLEKMNLLKSSIIYGANASGKSNLIKAMNFMRIFVAKSATRMQASDSIPIRSFKLSNNVVNEPSHFEVVFIHKGVKYRYGFQTTSEEIYKEWLYYVPNRKETKLFEREKDDFNIGLNFKEGKGLEEKTRKNALFLSVSAQFNGEISNKVLEWFKKFKIISGLNDDTYRNFTLKRMKEDGFKRDILGLLEIADLGIEDINVEERAMDENDLAKLPDVVQSLFKSASKAISTRINTIRKKEDNSGQIFDLEDEESEGTKKIFFLSGPIMDSLQNGNVLIVDELDSRLHPLIMEYLLSLFNSRKNMGSQLIFASHNTMLLNKDVFRRDQIWFTKKNKEGSSELYSLIDYKVRNNASFDKDYLMGKYGAIPHIGKERLLEE